jgi:hypothetical protein
MLILAAAALFSTLNRPPRFVLGTLLTFYLLFVTLRVTPAFVYDTGVRYSPDIQTERLTLARASGLRVDPIDAQLYEALIPLVQSHATGPYMYAAPDCPEVYFLSGLRNPTRSLFDVYANSIGHTEQVLNVLEKRRIGVVVINGAPLFSGSLDPVLRQALEQRYPYAAEIGPFEVRWNH